MIFISVRRTTNWQCEQTFLAQLSEDFRPKVETWNAVFNLPFHLFRHELKAIAQENLRQVRNAVCVPFEEVPAGALVVPVDDDDWLAPELGEVLGEMRRADRLIYVWQSSFLELAPGLGARLARLVLRDRFGRRRTPWSCSTNNYAFVKGEAVPPEVLRHMPASRFVDSHPSAAERFGLRLSVMNRSLGSQTALAWRQPQISRAELVRKHHRYRLLYSRSPETLPAWCGPYVRRMAELMNELRTR